MGKIDDLVKQLCPDGVEYRSIGSLIKRKSVKASKYNSDVDVYAVTNKRGFVLSSTLHDFDIFSSDISNYNVVQTDDFAYNPARLNIGSIALYKNETIGAVSPMYVVFEVDKESVLPEYLMVCFRSYSVTHGIESMKEVGARFRFDFKKWDRIAIPLPPLPIQQQIVEVLDLFTDMIDNLQTELVLREKQMTYYREKLLSFEGEEVEYVTLGDSFEIKTGKGVTKNDAEEGGAYPIISGGITPMGWINCFNRMADTVTISRVGANAGFVLFIDRPFYLNDKCFSIVPKEGVEINKKYLFYALKVREKDIMKLKSEGAVPTINTSKVGSLYIPLPPLSRQEKIVEVLDTFEALIANIKQEITLRQKQYEYYREKLLTFAPLKRAS